MKTILHTHLIIISSVLLSVDSCQNKKSAPTDSSAYTTPQQQTTTTSAPTQTIIPQPINGPANPKEENERFVVSFYSIGQGIDSKVNEEFVKFLDTYPNPKKINYSPSHWGREGEVDYCLTLKELTPAEQTEFVKKATELLAKSKLVHTKENAKCDHSNWPPLPNTAQEETYPLVISFYSKGGGIDSKVNGEFEKFLTSYSKKIVYEPTHWGREGEVDYCLKLSELSTAEQTDFVKKAKEVLSKSALVHINENTACVHKH
ncbi:MAG: hypothetical protein HY841_14080 [Bacteroidetes bacterium]|nr:hypothetical protein [Bacteroidota bacterium]